MLTLDELEYLCTELKMHIHFLEYVSSHMLGIPCTSDLDHRYALSLTLSPMKEIAGWLETIIEAEYS